MRRSRAPRASSSDDVDSALAIADRLPASSVP
jgi:hypothetical protein